MKKLPPHIPQKVSFEGLNDNPHTYEVVGFQTPKKGDYFLSGAVVQAYKAENDLNTFYWVVKPN
jgi:hypothetical protein